MQDVQTYTGTNLSATARLAAWSARHKWWVVGLTILAVVMAMAVSSAVAPKLLYDNDGGLDKEAAEAAQLADGAPCEAQLPGDGPEGEPAALRCLNGIPSGLLARRGSPRRRVQQRWKATRARAPGRPPGRLG